jgi:hypothetical protein
VLGGLPDPTVFNHDLRLTIDSSFSGDDLLRVRLRSGNFSPLPFGSSDQIFRLDKASATGGPLVVDRLYATVPAGPGLSITAGALVRNTGMLSFIPSAYSSRILDFFQLAGASGTYNRATGAGAGLQWNRRLDPSNQRPTTISVDLNVVAQSGFADASVGTLSADSGLNALGQLGLAGQNWGAAVAYRLGTNKAQIRDPNFTPRDVGQGQTSNSLAIGGYWQPIATSWAPSISVGYSSTATSPGTLPSSRSWMAGLQWDQLPSRNQTVGIAIGQPPFTAERETRSWLMEAFHSIAVSDHLTITAALLYASQDRNNNFRSSWGGLIQTTFRF